MSEKEILKHLFTDKKSFKVVQEKNLKASIFIAESDTELNRTRILFDIACDYYRHYNEALSRESLVRILAASKATNDTSAAILAAYDEVSLVSTTGPIAALIDDAKKQFRKIRLRTALTKAAEIFRSNALDDLVPYMQKEFYDITHDIDELSTEASAAESADSRYETYLSTVREPGVFCGFPTFDKATNGLYPGQLVLVAAATSEGKSVMLLNMAHNAWQNGKNVLFITIENYQPDLMRRFDALDAMVPYENLKNGTLSDDEKLRLKTAIEQQKTRPNLFYVVDKPAECTPAFIEAKIHDLMPIKFDLLVVDYLGIAKLDTRSQIARDEYYGQIAAELRRIGRAHKIPVVTAVQINREGMKEKGNMYGVQHIALSQLVANHTDIIMSMRAIDPKQAMASGIVDLECALIKHRDGRKARFALKANFERMKLQEQEIKCEQVTVVEPNQPMVEELPLNG